jgi:kynurenine aminotransferase
VWPKDYIFPKSLDGRGRDFRACWFIAETVGVSTIPVREFYCEEHANIGERFARFAFCKDADTLREAAERIQGLKKHIAK